MCTHQHMALFVFNCILGAPATGHQLWFRQSFSCCGVQSALLSFSKQQLALLLVACVPHFGAYLHLHFCWPNATNLFPRLPTLPRSPGESTVASLCLCSTSMLMCLHFFFHVVCEPTIRSLMGLFCIGSLHAFLPQLCLCFHVLCLRCRKTEHCKHPMWLSSVPRTFVKPEDAILYSLCTVDLLGSIGYNNLRYGHMSAPQHIVLQGTLEHRHFFLSAARRQCVHGGPLHIAV